MSHRIKCVEDLRSLAKKRVAQSVFRQIDGNVDSEHALKVNRAKLDDIQLRRRVMINVDKRNLSSTLLGDRVALPLAIAPSSLTGLVKGKGEVLAAQAAEEAGIPFTLSTLSACSIEQVALETIRPFWFQLYMMKDRAFVRDLIQRAKDAECSALVLTVDSNTFTQKHRVSKYTIPTPIKASLRHAIDTALKPRWLISQMIHSGKKFANLDELISDSGNKELLSNFLVNQLDVSLTWNDVDWIRSQWPGKLIIKGILDPEDAELAVGCGADAIVISNHGGRQLDFVPSSVEVMPAIIDAVGKETEVLFDSGVTNGQDILKCLALGAKGAMIDKAFLYGLGAMGKEGIDKVIQLLQDELDMSMVFTGCKSIEYADKSILY